jgi:hypothetical protein
MHSSETTFSQAFVVLIMTTAYPPTKQEMQHRKWKPIIWPEEVGGADERLGTAYFEWMKAYNIGFLSRELVLGGAPTLLHLAPYQSLQCVPQEAYLIQ